MAGVLPGATPPRAVAPSYPHVMNTDIPKAEYLEIEALIASDASPVGIDAKKTHIIILHKLSQIEDRLTNLERLALAKDRS